MMLRVLGAFCLITPGVASADPIENGSAFGDAFGGTSYHVFEKKSQCGYGDAFPEIPALDNEDSRSRVVIMTSPEALRFVGAPTHRGYNGREYRIESTLDGQTRYNSPSELEAKYRMGGSQISESFKILSNGLLIYKRTVNGYLKLICHYQRTDSHQE